MTTPIKRTRSGRSYNSPASSNRVEVDQQSIGPSRKTKRTQLHRKDDPVQIWQHDTHVASLDGDTIDPNWIPTTAQSSLATAIGSSRFLLRTGTPSDVLSAPHLPFAGSAHALSQAINRRYSASQHYIQKSQFLYRDTLDGHTSCVNALALSRGHARWLASAGDDKEIHIRDMFANFANDFESVPLLILKGHDSNVFSLDWSAHNQYLFSTGNDSHILYYDVEHSQIPIRGAVPSAPRYRSPLNANSIGAHDDAVPQLSAHPSNPNLVLSCDDGGALKFIDIRMPHDSVAAARSDVVAGFSSVQWNPNTSDGNTFAAATCGRITGSTRLYDVRQCFSSDTDHPLSSKDAVLSYHTALMQHSSKRGLIAAAAETNSICFDPDGRLLASSISRYHPTIYSVNDPDPLVTLESTVVDDPVQEGYDRWCGVPVGTPTAPKKLSSCCTVKHGSFGLQPYTGKLHYAIGSDDFRAYVFEIPDRDELLRQREFVNRRQWIQETSKLHAQRNQDKSESQASSNSQNHAQDQHEEHNSDAESDIDSGMVAESRVDHESEVAYCAGSILRANSIVRPARIQKQAFVLCGGRSIINTALIHPTLPLILTSGIVPEINIHSAFALRPKHVGTKDQWGEPKTLETGGTRTRFLLPPSSRLALVGEDSDESAANSDDDNEDREDDEDHDVEQADLGQGIQAQQARDRSPLEVSASSNAVPVQAPSVGTRPRAPWSDLSSSLGDAHERTADFEADNDDADAASPQSSSHANSDEYKWPYRRTSSNERNLYGSPSVSCRDSDSQGGDVQAAGQNAGTVDAGGASHRGQLHVTDNAGAQEPRHQGQTEATVQDFLAAMRSDPMYNTPAPLDYHQDRHIATYSLSHLSPDLLPADSPASSVSAADADVDANTPNTSHASSSEIEENDEDLDDLIASSEEEERSFNPYRNDGYGSTYAPSSELDERDQDEIRDCFQGEDEWRYSSNGRMWSAYRTVEHSRRLTKTLFLFDELLRRDELRSLTAGFRKVPQYAGGEGEGRDFTCGSCEGRIDTDE